VSELKAHLSRYLREVRRGGEVQILDRGVPVARLTAMGAAAAGREDERRTRLVRAGVLSPGSGDASNILDTAPLRLPTSLSDALEEDRADRL
jgi:antitoxin (DNA-binding transcriptional repressor) of toxin-antitoxin stability system